METNLSLTTKRVEITKEYENTQVKDDDFIKKISNQILDIFDKGYYEQLEQINPDFTDLRTFLMYFIDGNFSWEIKMNIYVSIALFGGESDFSNEIFDQLRTRFSNEI
jgi:hypothetical protein